MRVVPKQAHKSCSLLLTVECRPNLDRNYNISIIVYTLSFFKEHLWCSHEARGTAHVSLFSLLCFFFLGHFLLLVWLFSFNNDLNWSTLDATLLPYCRQRSTSSSFTLMNYCSRLRACLTKLDFSHHFWKWFVRKLKNGKIFSSHSERNESRHISWYYLCVFRC